MNLQWANASLMKSLVGPSLARSAAPSSEINNATASYRTDGPPSIFWFAATFTPSENVAPAILGAINSQLAPSSSQAAVKASNNSASAPSVANIPSLRPLKLLGPFFTMLSASDGGRLDSGA